MKHMHLFRVSLVALVLLANLAPMTAKAQENMEPPVFQKTENFVVENTYLWELVYELQPTVFINEDNRSFYGTENFKVLECAPSQISQLYLEDETFATVELIKIKFASAEEVAGIDLAMLSSFSMLQYVQLIYGYDVCGDETDNCLLSHAQNIISSGTSAVVVIFQLSMPH
jgi:hypothetical protein